MTPPPATELPAVRFTWTAADLASVGRLHDRPLVMLAVVWLPLGLIIALLAALTGRLLAVGLLAGLGLVVGLLRFVRPWLAMRRLRGLVGRELEVRLTPGGVAYDLGAGAREIPWSRLGGVREDGPMLLLVEGGIVRLGIPKRAFGGPGEVAAFRAAAFAEIEAARAARG